MSLSTTLAIVIAVDVAFIAGLALVLTPWKLRRDPGASLDWLGEEFEYEEAAPSWNGMPSGIIPH